MKEKYTQKGRTFKNLSAYTHVLLIALPRVVGPSKENEEIQKVQKYLGNDNKN